MSNPHYTKKWRSLMFMSEISIKPADPSKPMEVSYTEVNDYKEEWVYDTCRAPQVVSKDRRIDLGRNSVAHIKYDYPETFKKLVAACGDVDEAYRIYKELEKKVPDNWADYADEEIW